MSRLIPGDVLVEKLKEQKKRLGLGLTAFGKKYGVSPQYMRQVLIGVRLPGETMGFEKVACFRRIKKNRNGGR